MSESSSPLTWRLSDPGMGLLERAGLAALYMTLRATEEQGVDLSPLEWSRDDLTPESVTLSWAGADKQAITKLFRFAWQVREGVLYLPGVHREPKQRDFGFLRLVNHNGILNTFLQHVNVQPKGDLVRIVEQVKEGEELSFQYLSLDPTELLAKRAARKTSQKAKAPAEGARASSKPGAKKKPKEAKDTLKPLADLGEFFTSKDTLTCKPVSLSSWVMPGIAGRYGKEEAWDGPAKIGLLLVLAPIACLYQNLRGQGDNWVFVVPDVNDLTEFDEIRPSLGLDPTHVDISSLGDAGLRFSAEYATRSIRKEAPIGCLVTAMGRVGYYRSQRIRKGILEVRPTLNSVRRFTHLNRALPNRPIPIRSEGENSVGTDATGQEVPSGKRANVFYGTPAGRGRIADNLIAGRPWYSDLFTPLVWDTDDLERERKRRPGTSIERIWFTRLSFQGRLLMELVKEKEMWDTEEERIFLEVSWQTLRSLMRQEAEAAERGGSRSVDDRHKHLVEDLFRRLMRSKTRDLLRETLSELFAKAGRQKTIRAHPAAVWNLMNHPHNWKRARDLALLALATYSKKQEPPGSDSPNDPKGDDA